MGFILDITGSLSLTFFELNGIAEVTESRREDIEKNLMSGDYIIALSSKEVLSLPNLQVEAKFEFEVEDNTDYSFSRED